MSLRWRNNDQQNKVLQAITPGAEVIVYDTETTGLSPQKDRIIELAAIKFVVDEALMLHQIDTFHRYIRPPFFISQEITDLTGITNEQLLENPYEEDLATEIQAFFGTNAIVCGHNSNRFDINFMDALYKRNGLGTVEGFCKLDTIEMARDIISSGEVENYKLITLAKAYGLDNGITFHSALDDTTVTAKLFQIFILEYQERAKTPSVPVLKIQPVIRSINFWEGYRGYSRIYVETTSGSVYYNIRMKEWSPKDVDMDSLDMDYIESQCLLHTGCSTIAEFAKFTGKLKIS